MPKKSAIEIMVLNPDPLVHHHNKSVHENLWIKERFGKDNYLSIGVFLKEGTSELQFYFFEDCDKFPDLKFFSSLEELQEHLPPEKKDIFDRTHKVYLMGHGDAESKYGFGNYHAHDDFNHEPDNTEQIYGDEFNALIRDILKNIHTQNITLEACHADNLVTAEKAGYTQSFLERLSANYPQVTFSGTGPWSDSKDLQESLAQDSRASGGYPDLNVPLTAMGGSIWKNGNTVIFHHNGNQIAVRKSPFASTETAKALKINTIEYARKIFKDNEIITKICANREILSIEDLKKVPGFLEAKDKVQEIAMLVALEAEETQIIKKEKNRYITRVQAILGRVESNEHTDRDILIIALGLKDLSVFTDHEDLRDRIFANKTLLSLVMVACGKVIIAGPSNDDIIDLLLEIGVDINSVDANGMTALHHAAQNFYDYRKEPLDLVKKLLDSGANVDTANKKGQTPLMLAEKHSQKGIVMAGKNLVTLLRMTKIMRAADIPGVSVAIAPKDPQEKIVSISTGVTDLKAETPVTKDSLFGVASLSKPVFAYLVLKLIGLNQSHDLTPTTLGKFHLPSGIDALDLDTPLGDMIPTEEFGGNATEIAKAKRLTIRMILSHQTGLPIGHNPKNGPLKFDFEPGTEFGYSGIPFVYLQKVIEKLTGSTLDALAQKFVFSPSALNMPHSTFYRPEALYHLQPMVEIDNEPYKKPRFGQIYLEKHNSELYYMTADSADTVWKITRDDCLKAGIAASRADEIFSIIASDSPEWINALEPYKGDLLKVTAQREHTPTENSANSLYTTPEDYCHFMQGWVNDPDLNYAFEPQVCLAGKDQWAARENVSPEMLKKVGYGLGMALQLNEKGEAIRAYHTGDMHQYRTCVAVNLEKSSSNNNLTAVCFSNGCNGHMLIDQVIAPNIDVKEGFNVFFGKFSFARKAKELQPDWRETQHFGIKRGKSNLVQEPDESLNDLFEHSAASLFRPHFPTNTSAASVQEHVVSSPFSIILLPPGAK